MRRLAVALALLACVCSGAPDDARRSVLLISLDTLRASHTSPYGAELDTTPHLARFARESLQFDRAYATMPTTTPSHLSILTGLYPPEHGSIRNGVPAREGLVSLPGLLRDAGLRTAAFVSVAHLTAPRLGIRGFDVWMGPGPRGPATDGAVAVREALAWLDREPGRPFFLWLHLFDPHVAYEAHPGLSEEIAAELRALDHVPTPTENKFLSRTFSPDEVRKLELLYQADIHYTDSIVGRVLDALEKSGLDRRTAVFIVSDHGEVMAERHPDEPYAFAHGDYLQHGELRVPLWVRLPGMQGGRRVDEVVETRALFGSILWAAGVEVPSGAPRLPGLGAPEGSSDAAFSMRRSFRSNDLATAQRGGRTAVVEGRWLLVRIEAADGAVRLELYDVERDPLGVEDLAGERQDVVSHLDARLTAWQASLEGDPERDAAYEIDEESRRQLEALGYVE